MARYCESERWIGMNNRSTSRYLTYTAWQCSKDTCILPAFRLRGIWKSHRSYNSWMHPFGWRKRNPYHHSERPLLCYQIWYRRSTPQKIGLDTIISPINIGLHPAPQPFHLITLLLSRRNHRFGYSMVIKSNPEIVRVQSCCQEDKQRC